MTYEEFVGSQRQGFWQNHYTWLVKEGVGEGDLQNLVNSKLTILAIEDKNRFSRWYGLREKLKSLIDEASTKNKDFGARHSDEVVKKFVASNNLRNLFQGLGVF